MRFLRALLLILAAPLVWTWNGLRWVARRAWGVPPVLDAPTPAEVELEQAREEQALRETAPCPHAVLVACWAHAKLTGKPLPDVSRLAPQVQHWLETLSERALRELRASNVYDIERHVAGREIMEGMPRVPPRHDYDLRVSRAAAQAERSFRAAQEAVAARQRAEVTRPRTQLAAIQARSSGNA